MVVKKQTKSKLKSFWIGAPNGFMNSSKLSSFGPKYSITTPTNSLWIPNPKDRNLSWKQVKKKYPSMNPLGDYDNDLFFNYKDCKPLDPNRDGILAAIAGAVGGLFKKGSGTVKAGWKTGMAKTGWHAPIQSYKKWKSEKAERTKAQAGGFETYGGTFEKQRRAAEKAEIAARGYKDYQTPEQKAQLALMTKYMPKGMSGDEQTAAFELAQYKSSELNRRVNKSDNPNYMKIKEPSGHIRYVSKAKYNELMKGRVAKHEPEIKSKEKEEAENKWYAHPKSKLVKAIESTPILGTVYKAIPGLSETVTPVRWNKETKKWVPVSYSSKIESMRRKIQEGRITPMMRRKIMAVKRATRFAFPVIPAGATTATYDYQSKAGTGRGRGRPKGSVKYSIGGRPVGVFEYRKYLSNQRRAFRERIRQQQQIIRQQRRFQYQEPQYETQQYNPQQPQYAPQQVPQQAQHQVPQEVAGATPEYSQFPTQYEETQMPEQMLQQTPETLYPLQNTASTLQGRPIGTVFKSSGGSPYPPVERVPLAPSRVTAPQGYVETVDSFTGRRFMKKLPPTEKWSGGGGY